MRKSNFVRALALCIPATICTVHAQSPLLLQEVEMLDPQLSASVVVSDQGGGCATPLVEPWSRSYYYSPCGPVEWGSTQGTAAAADGSMIRWFYDEQTPDPACAAGSRQALRVLVTRPDGITREVLRVYTDRFYDCGVIGNPPCSTALRSNVRAIFDATNGVMLVERTVNIVECQTLEVYASDRGVIAISGFPTMLDIILSYQPPATLSFNVPAHPEGLPRADSFSVYSGNVRTASDLSQASALQCTVPSGRPPVAGEVLSVSDPLPDPPEGDARYYLAAVNYQGQRRAGRSAIGGVLKGRNAAALPSCQ